MLPQRSAILCLYRDSFRFANLLNNSSPLQRSEAITSLRQHYKNGAKETDPRKIEEMVQVGKDKLAYLRSITPRKHGYAVKSETGRKVFHINEKGEVVEGSAGKIPTQDFIDKRITQDQIDRHIRLLRRQHFMDRK